MAENLKFSTQKLEPLILKNCVQNPQFFLKYKKYLQTEDKKSYFNDKKYQTIFNFMAKYYDKLQKLPTKSTLEILAERVSKDPEISLYYQNIIDEMYTKEVIDEEFIDEETGKFVKEARVYEALMKAQDYIEKEDYLKMVSDMEEAVAVNFDTDFGVSIKDVDIVMEEIDKAENEKTISSGYNSFDATIGGGFKPKTLYVFSALPGYGKTLLKGNIALNMALNGHKVIYYSMEMAASQMMMRYYQNISHVSKRDFFANEEENIERLKEITSNIEGDIILKEYSANTICSNDLLAHAKDLMIYKNYKPEAIFVDYIMIMLPNSFDKNASLYERYKDVSIELRNIAKILDIPVITSIQINREGMDEKGGTKAHISSKAISGSRAVLDNADYFAIIGASKKEKERNEFKLIPDKNRLGGTSTIVNFEIDYDRMLIKEKSIIT